MKLHALFFITIIFFLLKIRNLRQGLFQFKFQTNILRYNVLKLERYNLYNIAIRFVRLHVTSVPGRFQRRYFVRGKSAVDVIEVGRYINTIRKDSSQKRAGFYNRNRKGFPLFINTATKYRGQHNKRYKNKVQYTPGRRHDFPFRFLGINLGRGTLCYDLYRDIKINANKPSVNGRTSE